MNAIKPIIFSLFSLLLIGCSNSSTPPPVDHELSSEKEEESEQDPKETEDDIQQDQVEEVKPTPIILVETDLTKSVETLNTEAIWTETFETNAGIIHLWVTSDYQLFASEGALPNAYLQENVTDNSTKPVILTSPNGPFIAFPNNQKIALYTFEEGQFSTMLEPVPTENGKYKVLDNRYLQTAEKNLDEWGGFNVLVYTVDLASQGLIKSTLYQLNEKTWDTWMNDDEFTYGFPLYTWDAAWMDLIMVEKSWKIQKDDIAFRQDYQDIISKYGDSMNVTQELNGVGVLRFPHGLNYINDHLISGFSTTSSVFTNSTEEVKQIIEDYTGKSFNYREANEVSGGNYFLDHAGWKIYLISSEEDYWDIYFFEPLIF